MAVVCACRKKSFGIAVVIASLSYHFCFVIWNLPAGLKAGDDDSRLLLMHKRELFAKPRAIFHVGPMKTGTSSIQRDIHSRDKRLLPFLEQDKFHVLSIKAAPLAWPHRNDAAVNATVLYRFNETGFLQEMERRSQQEENVFVSNEILFRVADQNHLVWEKLQEAMAPYDATVVVTYRRFFEWALSYYHQHASNRSRRGLVAFATEIDGQLQKPSIPVHPTLQGKTKYEQRGYNVSVFNFHGGTDLVSDFYCQYIGEASNTCLELRRKSEAGDKVHIYGRHFEWEYDRVAHAFVEHFGAGKDRHAEFRKAVAHRHAHVLKMAIVDFPKTCMSRELADRLLDMSLQMERDLMPDFYVSPRGEMEHRRVFEEYYDADQFCNVDVEKVVQDQSWLEYMREKGNIVSVNQ